MVERSFPCRFRVRGAWSASSTQREGQLLIAEDDERLHLNHEMRVRSAHAHHGPVCEGTQTPLRS